MKNTPYNAYLWPNGRNFRILKEIWVEEHVRFWTGSGNIALSFMRHASGHNQRNSSFIVDVAMGQIPRSTERISSFLWNGYLPIALHSICQNRLPCTEVRIYNGANSSRIWSRSQVSKSRSRNPVTTLFDLILHFFLRTQIWSFKLQPFPRYGESQNYKSRSRDPITTPFDLILHFLLGPPCAQLHAKFKVSSYNRSPDR